MVAPGFASLEIGPDQVRQMLEAGRIHSRRPVSKVFSLQPMRQQLGMTDPGGAPPAIPVVQPGNHRPMTVAGLERQGLGEGTQPVGVIPPETIRLVENGPGPLLAAHLEDLPELGLQRFAPLLGQFEPSHKIQFTSQSTALGVVNQQIIRNLTEEAPGRVVTGHRSNPEPLRSPLLSYSGSPSQ